MIHRISPALADTPVTGTNLRGASLGEVLSGGPTLLVFLRHFGWLFPREVVKDLRRVAGSDPRFPEVVFVTMAGDEDSAAFLEPMWPGAGGIADREKALFDAFGVERGGMREMFGLRAAACGVRAAVKGNVIGRKQGDPWTLPAFVLVDDGDVVWRHDGAHAGDHPDWSQIPRAAA